MKRIIYQKNQKTKQPQQLYCREQFYSYSKRYLTHNSTVAILKQLEGSLRHLLRKSEMQHW